MESKEIRTIAYGQEIYSSFWLRITDEEREGIWRDPDNNEALVFTNWDEESRSKYPDVSDNVLLDYGANWFDTVGSFTVPYVLCELT